MKTYNKKEIKNIFDTNLNEISVSDKLKKETLKKITSTPKHSFFWLSNCAAIFVVSLICLSLYINRPLHNNSVKLNDSTSQSISSQEILETEFSTSSYQKARSKSINESITTYDLVKRSFPNTTNFNYNSTTELAEQIQPEAMSDFTAITNSSIEIGTSEQELLNAYPYLEKIECGYLLKSENENIIYKISNGVVSEIIKN